jgi:hypothetical protein
MTGYRHAVVALHEMCEQDRDWILALLPGADRATLEFYLDEVQGLGFTTGTAFSPPESFSDNAGSGPVQPATGSAAERAAVRLRHMSAHRIAAILCNEPASLVAQFMAIEAWPWNAALLRYLEPGLRGRVNQARGGLMRIAPSRRRFLMQAVVSRLDENDAGGLVSHRPFFSAGRRMAHGWQATVTRLGFPWGR